MSKKIKKKKHDINILCYSRSKNGFAGSAVMIIDGKALVMLTGMLLFVGFCYFKYRNKK